MISVHPRWPCHCYQTHLGCQWEGLCNMGFVFYQEQWQKDAGESSMKGRKIRQGWHMENLSPIRASLGARVYPWILSKYFLCVRACVRPCVCRPTDKRRVCIFCVKTLNLCGILVVFGSYLEYNAITPFISHVLYRFLHASFFLVRRS